MHMEFIMVKMGENACRVLQLFLVFLYGFGGEKSACDVKIYVTSLLPVVVAYLAPYRPMLYYRRPLWAPYTQHCVSILENMKQQKYALGCAEHENNREMSVTSS